MPDIFSEIKARFLQAFLRVKQGGRSLFLKQPYLAPQTATSGAFFGISLDLFWLHVYPWRIFVICPDRRLGDRTILNVGGQRAEWHDFWMLCACVPHGRFADFSFWVFLIQNRPCKIHQQLDMMHVWLWVFFKHSWRLHRFLPYNIGKWSRVFTSHI